LLHAQIARRQLGRHLQRNPGVVGLGEAVGVEVGELQPEGHGGQRVGVSQAEDGLPVLLLQLFQLTQAQQQVPEELEDVEARRPGPQGPAEVLGGGCMVLHVQLDAAGQLVCLRRVRSYAQRLLEVRAGRQGTRLAAAP
jgi:hypothetical protein